MCVRGGRRGGGNDGRCAELHGTVCVCVCVCVCVGATAAGALTAMSASMPGIGIMDEGNERLSHKEVEQRRREKAKQVVKRVVKIVVKRVV